MNPILIHILILALLLPQSAFGFSRSRLDQLSSELAEFRDLTASAYAAQTLLERADYEAEMIIELLRKEVRFQPYAGVLRGPNGTLRSGAGNANDQAVTLASLLNDAGYDAQIARGTLSDAEASRLLGQFQPGAGERRGSEAEAPEFMRGIAEAVRSHAVDLSAAQEETATYARRLWTESKASRLVASKGTVQQTLIEEARDYRWVRYRMGSADLWVDVHPVFTIEPEDWQPRMESVESGSVAAEALHTVTLQLFMRRDASAAGTETVPLTNRLEFTAANLAGELLTFEMGSDGSAGRAAEQNLEQVIEDSYLFYPIVNGAVPEGLKVFDLNGRTYPAAALEGLNSVFETVSRKMDKASSQLADMGVSARPEEEADARSALQSVWIELGYEVPGSAEAYRVKRELYSRARDQPAAAQLLQRWVIDITTASPVTAYYESELAGLGVEVLQGYEKYVDYLAGHADMSDTQKIRAYSHFLPNQDRSRLLQLRQAFDSFDSGKVENYAHVPQLLAIRRGFAYDDGAWKTYELVDIIANSRRSLGAGDLPVPDALVGFSRGVWETRMESVGPPSAGTASTQSAFSLLKARGDWSSTIQEGVLVVDSAEKDEQSVWWSLDARTGSAIGMLDTPWGVAGADAIDYVTNAVLIGISALLATTGAYICSTQAGNSVECCIESNVGLFFVGVAIGISAGLIGMAIAGSAVATAGSATASVIAGTAADIAGLGIPIDCSAR